MRQTPILLVVLLSGCSLLDLTKDRPSSAQINDVGEIFGQMGTVAGVIDDPTTASGHDLVEATRFDQYARLVSPGTTKPLVLKAFALPAPLPGCVAVSENSRTFTSCDVILDDGRACVVSGTLSRAPGPSGTTYTGHLALGAGVATCPTATLDLDVYLEGPPSSPTKANGSASFSVADPIGDTFSGTATIEDIAVTGPCTVPSSGSLKVTVTGTASGKAIDESITLSFHEDPGCGIIFLE